MLCVTLQLQMFPSLDVIDSEFLERVDNFFFSRDKLTLSVKYCSTALPLRKTLLGKYLGDLLIFVGQKHR